jgi:hypothetical protein
MNLLNTYRHIANNGEKYHESRCYFEVGVDDNEIKWFLHDTQKNSRINVAPMFHRDILSVINSINIEDEDIDAFDHCLVIQKPNLDVASSTKKTGVHTHLVFLSLVYKEGKATWVLDAYASGRFKSYYLYDKNYELLMRIDSPLGNYFISSVWLSPYTSPLLTRSHTDWYVPWPYTQSLNLTHSQAR